MTAEEYHKCLSRYVDHITSDVKLLAKFEPPVFKTLLLSCDKIDSESEEWIRTLEDSGIDETATVLYYFSIMSECSFSVIQDEIKRYKKTSSKYKALPKVNNLENGHHTILYVGKTNSNFVSRLKHHLGLANDHTYALHLKYWASKLNLQLTLHYSVLDIPDENIRFLEQMENIFHFNMTPILGRAAY